MRSRRGRRGARMQALGTVRVGARSVRRPPPRGARNRNPDGMAEAGFSLLETMIALAILSVASAIMFQSMSTQFRLADRTAAASGEALSRTLSRVGPKHLVQSLLPGWPEATDEVFAGDAAGFRGLSAAPLQHAWSSPAAFSLHVVSSPAGSELVYSSEGVQWSIDQGRGEELFFSYMTVDHTWRATWPPASPVILPPFGDGRYYEPDPLPIAIRLQARGASGEVSTRWIAEVQWRGPRPPRIQDLTQ